jgi:hypothetical protein
MTRILQIFRDFSIFVLILNIEIKKSVKIRVIRVPIAPQFFNKTLIKIFITI